MLTDAEIHDRLTVIMESANRCRICGGENDNAHMSELHIFEECDIVALFHEEFGDQFAATRAARPADTPLSPDQQKAVAQDIARALPVESKRQVVIAIDARAISCLSPWLNHHSGCARVTRAGFCDCGLDDALLSVDPTLKGGTRG